MKANVLSLISVQRSATTYSFGGSGWALCTVNDATGELLITSDWGEWAHRWPTNHRALGAPSLTAFIAARDGVDYLASKLLGDRVREFSADGTIKKLRRLLCESRLEAERWWRSDELMRPAPRLSKSVAREIWDELDEFSGLDNQSVFTDRMGMYRELIELVDEYPWDYFVTVPTSQYKVLSETILPALIGACRMTVMDPHLAHRELSRWADDGGAS